MKALDCEWTWMAEALDDGRVDDEAQAAAFQRHANACAACRLAAAEVTGLRATMEALPEPPLADLHHRRQRQRLMGRAARRLGEPPSPLRERRGLRRLLVAAAAGVAMAAAALLLGARAPRTTTADAPALAAAASPPRYEVTGLAGASWDGAERGGVARVSLRRGSAAFHVHRLEPGQRFLVDLPDGELEVRGTRFVVYVAGARTRYVVVMEGKVALRLTGAATAERILIAGQRWDASGASPVGVSPADVGAGAAPPAGGTVDGREASVVAGGRSRTRSTSPRAAGAGTGTTAGASPTAGDGASVTAAASASARFAAGVEAFRDGRYDAAERIWGDFLADHPGDPRAEDAAFLRAVGRARAGDAAGAARLARSYLDHFPRGLRRREAEALGRHDDPTGP